MNVTPFQRTSDAIPIEPKFDKPAAPQSISKPSRLSIVIAIASLAMSAVALATGTLKSQDQPISNEAAIVGFAERFVSTFLTASGESNQTALTPFLGFAPDLTGTRIGDWYVARTSAVSATPYDDHWQVTVAVDLLAKAPGGFEPTEPRYFSVNLSVDGPQIRADGLPALVPPPATASPSAPPQLAAPGENNAVADATSAWLKWYLTGDTPIGGEMPVGGYSRVELISVVSKGQTVAVEALAIDDMDRRLRLHFQLAIDPSGPVVIGLVR